MFSNTYPSLYPQTYLLFFLAPLRWRPLRQNREKEVVDCSHSKQCSLLFHLTHDQTVPVLEVKSAHLSNTGRLRSSLCRCQFVSSHESLGCTPPFSAPSISTSLPPSPFLPQSDCPLLSNIPACMPTSAWHVYYTTAPYHRLICNAIPSEQSKLASWKCDDTPHIIKKRAVVFFFYSAQSCWVCSGSRENVYICHGLCR